MKKKFLFCTFFVSFFFFLCNAVKLGSLVSEDVLAKAKPCHLSMEDAGKLVAVVPKSEDDFSYVYGRIVSIPELTHRHQPQSVFVAYGDSYLHLYTADEVEQGLVKSLSHQINFDGRKLGKQVSGTVLFRMVERGLCQKDLGSIVAIRLHDHEPYVYGLVKSFFETRYYQSYVAIAYNPINGGEYQTLANNRFKDIRILEE